MDEAYPSINLEGIYKYLKRFALSDSLYVIGAVNSALKGGVDVLHTDGIPQGTINWINARCKDRHARTEMTLHLSRLARLLLLSGSNDYKSEVLDTGNGNLQNAIYYTSILHEPEVDNPKNAEDLKPIIARLSQWQFPLQRNRVAIVGRGQMLFLDIPDEIKPAYDFNAKSREYFDMDVFQFFATGHCLWVKANGLVEYNMTIEIDALKEVVTPETLSKFATLSSGTAEEYRRRIRGGDWKTSNPLLDLYGLDPFAFIPAIKVEHSVRLPKGAYVTPQPFFWLQRASVGLFYLLADKEYEIGKSLGQHGRNDFRESFGYVYRAYVGKHLALATATTHFVDLDTEITTSGEKPDFALVEGGTCVLFEVKTALLKLDARTIFDTDKTRAEVKEGSLKRAVGQLNSFEETIRAGKITDKRFKNVSKFVKIIVGFEDVYLANVILLPLLRETYGDDTMANFQIATIGDIEYMGTMLAQGGNLVSLLREKVETAELVEYGLSPVIQKACPDGSKENPLLEKAFMAFWSRMTGGAPFRG